MADFVNVKSNGAVKRGFFQGFFDICELMAYLLVDSDLAIFAVHGSRKKVAKLLKNRHFFVDRISRA